MRDELERFLTCGIRLRIATSATAATMRAKPPLCPESCARHEQPLFAGVDGVGSGGVHVPDAHVPAEQTVPSG